MGQTPTADQTALFANRNDAGPNDIVVYFVQSTIPPLNGCAAFPAGQPGAVVTQGASPWTMAHEVGHVLGLSHIAGESGPGGPCSTPDFTRLMTGCGTGNITGTPTLTAGEGTTMRGSAFTRQCVDRLRTLDISRNADGRLEVFGVASDGTIWHAWQTAPATWPLV
jgi:hypothetical protein